MSPYPIPSAYDQARDHFGERISVRLRTSEQGEDAPEITKWSWS
jgi:hypothetical protein